MLALESRLTLVAWFAHTLGYRSNASMLERLKGAADGWGAEGVHNTLVRLCSEQDIPQTQWDLLEELDTEIQADWEAINRRRQTRLSLKYFQYLACLSSAYYLWRLADSPEALANDLGQFTSSRAALQSFSDRPEVNKLAFWMATGSGKTLLMHMHYRQFLRHQQALFVPDNILLITPNEELSRQHIAEMQASNIPCFLHREGNNLFSNKHAVRVVEITKFVDENSNGKRGKSRKKKGESVAVEAFSGRNLVFVDEGHKGSGGNAWFERRDTLTHNGFVFEYSATFGQALSAADRDERTAEYAHAIAFDYSYQYFYEDGYGKDFSILNISDSDYPTPDETPRRDLLMLGNLLAFFQQQWAFKQNNQKWLEYRVEKPLLLLLGATVTGKKINDAQTDMVSVIAFLQRVVADKNAQNRTWLEEAVATLFNARSGINTDGGTDAFVGKFEYLKEEFVQDDTLDAHALCRALRNTLFYTDVPGTLRFLLLKQTKGDGSEICLKVGDDSPPFGLIFVGSPTKLRELVKAHVPDVEVGDDAVQKPLFAETHTPASPINILIGARKFMEGWSSWRVSGMGLMNVGKSEGAQIIQLFGRGVRLRGKNFSLKRSAALQREDSPPEHLELLETLNIFAIRANFMAYFRDYLQREGVPKKFILPLMLNPVIEEKKLQTLKMPSSDKFCETVFVQKDDSLRIKLEMRAKIQARRAGDTLDVQVGNIAAAPRYFDDELIALLDFDDLYRRLLEYKRDSQRKNLLLSREQLPDILKKCEIYSSDSLKPQSYAGARRLQQIAFSALRKYVHKLYYHEQRKWEACHARYYPLFDAVQERPPEYIVTVRHSENDKESQRKFEQIQNLINNEKSRYRYNPDPPLPRLGSHAGKSRDSLKIHFDEHIYIPLLLEPSDPDITISPPGLTDSEKSFAKSLREYITEHPLPKGRDVFLLRNESKGRGVGFYESEGFYPDFILWIKDGDKQRIVFIEPHGMLHAPVYEQDFKARLWEQVQKLSAELHQRDAAWENLTIDSYIVSDTPYAELKPKYGNGNWHKEDFRAHHILFAEDGTAVIEHIIG